MVDKFKFWCQKVLPTIYDDSLSYYEAICKIATYLNATIEQVNEFQKMIDALPETILNSEKFQQMLIDAVDGKIDALYKVVQDALDAFEREQNAFEKQVNDSNTAFRQQVNNDNAAFKQQVNTKLSGYEADNTQFKNEVNTSNTQFKQEVNGKLAGYETDNATFKQQVNAKVDEIPKKVAEYPKYPLCQNSNGAVTNMFDVLMTYYHKSNVVYNNFKTPFNTNAAPVSAGEYGLDCSSLVQLCLMGVPYENTRWFNDKNVPTSGYYFGDDLIINPEADRPYGMLSDDMCKWFVEHGYYFETDDPTQLRPGDVVFMTFDDTSPNYKHVTHCNIFVSYQAITDELYCIGANKVTDARPFVVSRESYKRTSVSFVGFGRLPLPDCEFNAKNLLAEKQSQIKNVDVQLDSTTHVKDAGRIRTPNSLEANKMYTLVAKIRNATLPLFFTLQSGNTTITLISLSGGSWVYVPFVLNFPNKPEVKSTPLDAGLGLHVLSVYARTLTSETVTVTRSVIFENLALYEGVVISPIGETPKNPPYDDNDVIPQHIATLSDWRVVADTAGIEFQLNSIVVDGVANGLTVTSLNVAQDTTTLKAGQYLVYTYAANLTMEGNIKFGGQYILGVSSGAIYGRFASNSKWGNIVKIAPYTPE